MENFNIDMLFKKIDDSDFDRMFPSEESILAYLAQEKWKDGWSCRLCGNTNYCKGRSPYSRRCTRCKKEESPTVDSIFHRCRIPLRDALKIAYMVCHAPGISSYELSRRIDLRQMTCWKFKKKITECLESRNSKWIQYSIFHSVFDVRYSIFYIPKADYSFKSILLTAVLSPTSLII